MYNYQGKFMKKNRSKKNKSNVSITKNPYYIALKNAGKRTAGNYGQRSEGLNVFFLAYDAGL